MDRIGHLVGRADASDDGAFGQRDRFLWSRRELDVGECDSKCAHLTFQFCRLRESHMCAEKYSSRALNCARSTASPCPTTIVSNSNFVTVSVKHVLCSRRPI